MNAHQNTPAGIAAALRRAADDIEAMGDVELSTVWVSLNLQAVQHEGTGPERIATVDALCRALLGVDGVMHHTNGLYHEPAGADESRGDLKVDIYTDPAEYRRGGVL